MNGFGGIQPFSQAPGGNTAMLMQQQMMMMQMGYGQQMGGQQQFAPTNFYQGGRPGGYTGLMGRHQYNPNLPHMQMKDNRRNIHNAAIGGSVYGAYATHPDWQAQQRRTGQPADTVQAYDPRLNKTNENSINSFFIIFYNVNVLIKDSKSQ